MALTNKEIMARRISSGFKMKGSPFQRNFGVGVSPAKALHDVDELVDADADTVNWRDESNTESNTDTSDGPTKDELEMRRLDDIARRDESLRIQKSLNTALVREEEQERYPPLEEEVVEQESVRGANIDGEYWDDEVVVGPDGEEIMNAQSDLPEKSNLDKLSKEEMRLELKNAAREKRDFPVDIGRRPQGSEATSVTPPGFVQPTTEELAASKGTVEGKTGFEYDISDPVKGYTQAAWDKLGDAAKKLLIDPHKKVYDYGKEVVGNIGDYFTKD